MALPPLTPEQRAAALEKAAEARRVRAEVKNRLKRSGASIAEVIASGQTDDIIGKMKVSALLESMPGEVHDYWDTQTTTDRPIGYYGTNLGYELDLAYTYQYRKEVEIGGGLAGGLPGSAWRTSTESNVGPSIGVMGSFALKF